MEKLRPLVFFCKESQKEARLLPTHQSLFLALFFFWQQSGYIEPFRVSRRELMPLARIGSVATYHKCLRELESFGYIEYLPTYNYYKGSQVRFLYRSQSDVLDKPKTQTKAPNE